MDHIKELYPKLEIKHNAKEVRQDWKTYGPCLIKIDLSGSVDDVDKAADLITKIMNETIVVDCKALENTSSRVNAIISKIKAEEKRGQFVNVSRSHVRFSNTGPVKYDRALLYQDSKDNKIHGNFIFIGT